MQDMIEARLAGAGYVNYETSAFARPGRECRHNLNYWRFGDYLGIGAGAHPSSRFPTAILRQMRYKQPREYMQKTPQPARRCRKSTRLAATDLRLRIHDECAAPGRGLRVGAVRRAHRPAAHRGRAALGEAVQRGLITRDHVRIAPTPRGQRFLNDLLQLFLRRTRGLEFIG